MDDDDGHSSESYVFDVRFNDKSVLQKWEKVPKSSQWLNGPSFKSTFLALFPQLKESSSSYGLLYYDKSCSSWQYFEDSNNPLDYCAFTLEYPRYFNFRIISRNDTTDFDDSYLLQTATSAPTSRSLNIFEDISSKITNKDTTTEKGSSHQFNISTPKSQRSIPEQVAWITRQNFFSSAKNRPSLPPEAFHSTCFKPPSKSSNDTSQFYQDPQTKLLRCRDCKQPQSTAMQSRLHSCYRQKNKVFLETALRPEYYRFFETFTTRMRNIKYCHLKGFDSIVCQDLLLYFTQRIYTGSGRSLYFRD